MKDIAEIRKANLARLVESQYRGRPSELASRINVTVSYVSQLSSSKKIGSATARKIETASGLERGWMDSDHDPNARSNTERAFMEDPQLQSLVNAFQDLSRADRALLLSIAKRLQAR